MPQDINFCSDILYQQWHRYLWFEILFNMANKKLIDGFPFIQHVKPSFATTEMLNKSEQFHANMDKRRTCRDFSNKPISKEVIENIILTASTAPSGAHKQPWTFCVVSNAEIKNKYVQRQKLKKRKAIQIE